MAKISKEPIDFMGLPGGGGEMDNVQGRWGEGGEGGGGGGCSGGGEPLEPITRIPDIDMYSTKDELYIEVEMPGVEKKDIELCLQKNTVKLMALKVENMEDRGTNYVCLERVFGRLYRSIEIPFPVNTSAVRATLANGVLTIVMPRIEDKRAEKKSVPIESK